MRSYIGVVAEPEAASDLDQPSLANPPLFFTHRTIDGLKVLASTFRLPLEANKGGRKLSVRVFRLYFVGITVQAVRHMTSQRGGRYHDEGCLIELIPGDSGYRPLKARQH